MSDEAYIQFSEREALLFHSEGRPGKIEIIASKPMATQRDLSLAYSPGVAVPVNAIAEDPGKAYDLTAKGNLVAVISNGTAILGLGNLGAQILFEPGRVFDRVGSLKDVPDGYRAMNDREAIKVMIEL